MSRLDESSNLQAVSSCMKGFMALLTPATYLSCARRGLGCQSRWRMALSPRDPSRQGRLSPPMARVKNDAELQLNKRTTPRSPSQAAPWFSMDLLITCLFQLEPWECTHLNANPSWAEAHSSCNHGGCSMAAAPSHASSPRQAAAACWPLPWVGFICSRSHLLVSFYFKSPPRTRSRNLLHSNSSQDN